MSRKEDFKKAADVKILLSLMAKLTG